MLDPARRRRRRRRATPPSAPAPRSPRCSRRAPARVLGRASRATPTTRTTRAGLLEAADAALYAAKRHRPRADLPLPPEPRAPPVARRGARRDRGAAARRRHAALSVAFQPVLELATGRVAGYEALARFHAEPAARARRVVRPGAPRRPRRRARGRRAARRAGRPRPPRRHLPGGQRRARARCAHPDVRAALPEDLSGDRGRADRARAVRRRGRARLAPGRAARPRRADRARRRRRRLRGPAADHPVAPDILKLDRSLVHGAHADPATARAAGGA